MTLKLTPKQESFCYKFIETGNASKAYRQSYDTKNMKPATINRKAKELLDNGKIAARISGLQARHQARHDITVDYLTDNMLENRELARTLGKPETMQSADMGLAKLHGRLTDKMQVGVDPDANIQINVNFVDPVPQPDDE